MQAYLPARSRVLIGDRMGPDVRTCACQPRRACQRRAVKGASGDVSWSRRSSLRRFGWAASHTARTDHPHALLSSDMLRSPSTARGLRDVTTMAQSSDARRLAALARAGLGLRACTHVSATQRR